MKFYKKILKTVQDKILYRRSCNWFWNLYFFNCVIENLNCWFKCKKFYQIRKKWSVLWGEHGGPGTQNQGHPSDLEPEMECVHAVHNQGPGTGRSVYHGVWPGPVLT